MFTFRRCISVLVFVAFFGSGCMPVDSPQPVANTNAPAPTVIAPSVTAPVLRANVVMPETPYDLISQESLPAYLEDLTSISHYPAFMKQGVDNENKI
jgi:hypothetical protein